MPVDTFYSHVHAKRWGRYTNRRVVRLSCREVPCGLMERRSHFTRRMCHLFWTGTVHYAVPWILAPVPGSQKRRAENWIVIIATEARKYLTEISRSRFLVCHSGTPPYTNNVFHFIPPNKHELRRGNAPNCKYLPTSAPAETNYVEAFPSSICVGEVSVRMSAFCGRLLYNKLLLEEGQTRGGMEGGQLCYYSNSFTTDPSYDRVRHHLCIGATLYFSNSGLDLYSPWWMFLILHVFHPIKRSFVASLSMFAGSKTLQASHLQQE